MSAWHKYTNQITALLITFLLGLFLLGSVFILQKKDLYIQNLGSQIGDGNTHVNSINVSGQGKVYTQPDMVSLEVTASFLADTTSQAMGQVNDQIQNVLDIADTHDISTENIQTAQLSITPEYDWTDDGREFKGQRARQSLSIKVKDVKNDSEKVSKLLDDLVTLENLEVGNIVFQKEDTTEVYKQARDLAFEKAEQKARQLADLAGVELIKPIVIDDRMSSNTQLPMTNSFLRVESMNADAGSEIPAGQLLITVDLQIVWAIK